MGTGDWITLSSVIVAIGAILYTIIESRSRKRLSQEIQENDTKNRIERVASDLDNVKVQNEKDHEYLRCNQLKVETDLKNAITDIQKKMDHLILMFAKYFNEDE